MTNYQRQQLLGTATAGLAGSAANYLQPGQLRFLTGATGAGGNGAIANEAAMRRLLSPNALETPSATERGYLSSIERMANQNPVDPLEQQGLNRQESTIDPSRNLAAANQYVNQISGPAITSALNAGGMGRSGAGAEALAQEGTRMALPILSDSLGATRGLASSELGLGGQLRDRRLANLQTALSAAEAPRLADLASTTKPEQLLLSAYGLPPQATGAGSYSTRSSQNYYPSAFSTAMKGVQAVASIAGAFMGACWVAEAVYGQHDPRFWHAWRYVNFDPSRRARVVRFVYLAVGRRVARLARQYPVVRRAAQWVLERVIPA